MKSTTSSTGKFRHAIRTMETPPWKRRMLRMTRPILLPAVSEPPLWMLCCPPRVPSISPPAKTFDFLEKITKSLNPENQAHRDAECTSTMFQSQQLLLFQSQVRELNTTIQSLRMQLDNAERRWADADRRADRLQQQLDLTTRGQLFRPADMVPHYHGNPPPASPSSSSSPASTPDHDRRYEATFNDGGHCTWFGNGSRFDDDDNVILVERVRSLSFALINRFHPITFIFFLSILSSHCSFSSFHSTFIPPFYYRPTSSLLCPHSTLCFLCISFCLFRPLSNSLPLLYSTSLSCSRPFVS